MKTFIVIDALDEFPDEHRNDLVAEIQRVEPKISLLIFSRPPLNIELDPQNTHRLEIRARNEDITRYLEESISNSARLKGLVKKQPSLKEKITSTIIEKAQSM